MELRIGHHNIRRMKHQTPFSDDFIGKAKVVGLVLIGQTPMDEHDDGNVALSCDRPGYSAQSSCTCGQQHIAAHGGGYYAHKLGDRIRPARHQEPFFRGPMRDEFAMHIGGPGVIGHISHEHERLHKGLPSPYCIIDLSQYGR